MLMLGHYKVLVLVFDDKWWRFGGDVVDLLKGLSVGFGEGAHVGWFCRVETSAMLLEGVRLDPVFIEVIFSPFAFFVKSTKKVAGESGWKDTLHKRGRGLKSERKLTKICFRHHHNVSNINASER